MSALPQRRSSGRLPAPGKFRDPERTADPVRLNHPYCAQFCVLGGGFCSLAS